MERSEAGIGYARSVKRVNQAHYLGRSLAEIHCRAPSRAPRCRLPLPRIEVTEECKVSARSVESNGAVRLRPGTVNRCVIGGQRNALVRLDLLVEIGPRSVRHEINRRHMIIHNRAIS